MPSNGSGAIGTLLFAGLLLMTSCQWQGDDEFRADAGANLTVSLGTKQIPLDGSATNHQHGEALKYHWEIVASPPGSRAPLVQPQSAQPRFSPDLAGLYTFRLTVEDGVHRATDTVSIDVNSPPRAVIHAPSQVFTGEHIILNGASSSDPDRQTLKYFWSIIDKPPRSAAQLSDPRQATTGLTVSQGDQGVYTVQLEVSDGLIRSRSSFTLEVKQPLAVTSPAN